MKNSSRKKDIEKIKSIIDLIINLKEESSIELNYHGTLSLKDIKKVLPESHGFYNYLADYVKKHSDCFSLYGIELQGALKYNGMPIGFRS